ncbi:hypothetical protein [Pseudooctadecabacter sp.]|uniref:hypothetical protein n=1 Tax=Pseudooctadecabacter sp. TaxID=1966338 RepID=UPI0025F6C06C|nr:hypothetical protein [Pseudooctadecabacter sp.]
MADNPSKTPFGDIQKNGIIVLPWVTGMSEGAGFDSLSLQPKGAPYDPQKSDLTLKPTSGSSSQTFTQAVRRIESSSQLNDALSVSASVSASYGLFSATASSTFQKETQVNNYSLYFLVSSFVRNSEEQITRYALSDAALALDGNTFRQKYGDYYVGGVVSGGTLYALLNLSTNSRETKQKITASLDAKYSGGLSVGGKFSTEISHALKTSGVDFSSEFKTAGATAEWNASAKHDTVDDIIASANSFPVGVNEGGAPMFAILMPYSLLAQAPQPADSISTAAVNAVRKTLTAIYLQADQILNSVNYALQNPKQFSADIIAKLPKVQHKMTQVMQDIQSANDAIMKDPANAASVKLPKMPPLTDIPERLWGGSVPTVSPVPNVVPTTLRYTLGEAQTEVWAMTDKPLQTNCQRYLDQVTADVTSNYSAAFNFIATLASTVKALDEGVTAEVAKKLVQSLAGEITLQQTKWDAALAQQKAAFGSFAGSDPDTTLPMFTKVLNPVIWDTTSDSVTFGGSAYWAALDTMVKDQLVTIADAWPQGTTPSKGGQYFHFPDSLWAFQQAAFHDAMETQYVSVPA